MEHKATGFASPAQGYENSTIDLNGLLIKNPPATFFFRLESGDMARLGLAKGSILVVDRSIDAKPDDFVLIVHEGRFLCRLMINDKNKIIFTNGKNEIMPTENDTAIIGVVTAAIRGFKI